MVPAAETERVNLLGPFIGEPGKSPKNTGNQFGGRNDRFSCKDIAEMYTGAVELPSDPGNEMTKDDESLDLVKQAIREAGLRATPARIATLQLLRESPSPLTHAAVAEHLSGLGVDKATAFRNLNDMTDAGLLRRTEVGDHVWRFETIGDDDHDRGHPHFLCVDCGSVSCMDDVKLTAASQRASEQVGQVTEILLRGRCNDCRP